jgi:hypothetical protein
MAEMQTDDIEVTVRDVIIEIREYESDVCKDGC